MDYKHFFVMQSLQFVLLDYNYLKSLMYIFYFCINQSFCLEDTVNQPWYWFIIVSPFPCPGTFKDDFAIFFIR